MLCPLLVQKISCSCSVLLKTVGTGEKNCSVVLLSYFIEKTLSISDVTAANTASSRSSLVATFVYQFSVARFRNLTHFSSKDAFWMAKNYWGKRISGSTCELLDLALQGYSLEYYFRIFIFGTREDCQINITGSATERESCYFLIRLTVTSMTQCILLKKIADYSVM